jgi:hypothetical protein
MSYVYTYITPITVTIGKKLTILPNQPFYIGKGSGTRFKDHITASKLHGKNQNWLKLGVISKIKKAGYDPIIEVGKDILSDTEAFSLERKLIQEYGRICNNTGVLTNFTLGGEGPSGWHPSQATRELWSKQRKGKPNKRKGIKTPGIGGRPKGVKWSDKERETHKISNQKPESRATHKTLEFRKKMSDLKIGWEGSAKGKTWFNDGNKETYSFNCPIGFVKGRLFKQQLGKRGLVWYNNGLVNRQFLETQQEEGFNRGRIIKK